MIPHEKGVVRREHSLVEHGERRLELRRTRGEPDSGRFCGYATNSRSPFSNGNATDHLRTRTGNKSRAESVHAGRRREKRDAEENRGGSSRA